MSKKILFSFLAVMSLLYPIYAGDYTWTKFTPVSGQPVWSGIGISNDGGTLAASAWNNYVYISSDNGATWSKKTPAGTSAKGWTALSMSTDGKILAVSAWNDFIYYSNDSGKTWSKLSPASNNLKGWKAVTLNTDGTIIVACAYNDYIYASKDAGKTWSKLSPAGSNVTKGWNSVAINKDASVIAVSAFNDYIYISKDSGKTWSQKKPAGATVKGWVSVNCSEDGKVIAATAYNDFLYLSKDSGSTWSKKSPAGTSVKGWTASSMSSDGTKFAVSAENDYVYTSKDSGSTWEKNDPSGAQTALNWLSVFMSATGTRLITANQKANIFAGVSASIPWKLVFEAGEGGTLLENAQQEVLDGADALPVTAIANTGYEFAGWTGDVTDTANPLIVKKVKKSMKIIAKFALKKYTVKFETDGTPGAEITGETEQTVEHGKDCSEVSISVPNGFYFAGWLLNDNLVSSNNPFTATGITEARTYIAKFAEIPVGSFIVAFIADSSKGTIQGNNIQTIPAGGSTTEVTAVGNSANHFVLWTKNGEEFSKDNPLVINGVNQNMTLNAEFEINSYTVKFETDGTEDATLDGEVEQVIIHGSDCSPVTAVAPKKAYFVKWTQDGKDISVSNPYTAKKITSNKTFIANFTIVPDGKFAVVFFANPSSGKIEGETLQIVASGESATEVKAVPNEGYSFQKWLKNGTELSKDNPLVVSEVNENMTIQAVISQNIYTLTYVAGEHGSIKGAALQRVVHGGSGTPVTAVPDEGYEFTEWSDGVKDNPRTDANVKSDISVTAQFAQKQAWTNFEILRTQARSNRSIAAKGLKDSYNFKIKAQVPNDFSWNEILNEEVKISFGDNFNFAGTLNPINSRYDVFNLQKGGRATFVENLLSLNTEMRKARKISLRWNKKNELYITMRNIQAPGKQDNIIGVNDFEFVPERELIGKCFSKVSVVLGKSSSGKYELEFKGKIIRNEKYSDSNEEFTWQLGTDTKHNDKINTH